MDLYLGVDGGGTHTRAVLVDASGHVHGRGTAGPSNHHNVPLAEVTANLRAAVAQAHRAADVPLAPASGAFLGLAGVKSAADAAHLTAAAESLGLAAPGTIVVANDLHNALAGGLAGAPGIALIAGTGSNCLGRDEADAVFMCGGWGWLLDDSGAGFGLALAALRAAVRAHEGRADFTRLLPSALAFFGLTEPNELLTRLHRPAVRPEEIAAFAPVVAELAAGGDAVAESVLRDGAAALAELVATTASRLHFTDGPSVVLLGGCVKPGTPYRALVEAAIRQACPPSRVVEAKHDPLHGAALNALRTAIRPPRPPLRRA
jgi:N-acetylglucosamine kinase-like BadF-type ATPase